MLKPALKKARAWAPAAGLLYVASRPVHDIARAAQFRIARHVLRNGGTAVYDGVCLTFPKDIGLGYLSSISWHGVEGFEPHTWRVLRRLIEQSDTFIDVGANIGFYSVLARCIAPQNEIISFEPVPGLCEQARVFHAANDVAANLHQLALSDQDGEATIFQPIEEVGSSTATLETHSWQARKDHVALTVPTAKLDSFLVGKRICGPLAIKIDVEDHEAAVLRGARETIAKHRPAIVCEILPREHHNAATTAILSEFGYVAFAITESGCFRFSADDFKSPRRFTDFLLLPTEQTTTNFISI